jgi:hypothetical protein
MSEQEEYNLQQSQEGEQASNQSKEVETTETAQQKDSPIRPPAYSPARETPSTYFTESPLESPLLQEHSHSRSAPRHFNPPLPVSPSSLILKKDSKKKRR